ncbi:unnamed protein product [Adineta ricciae]|nr:unnamed protein product [Adineta ricciae]
MVFGKEHAGEWLAKTPIAFIGTISDVVRDSSTRSIPPIDSYKLRFQNVRTLRGSIVGTEFDYQQRGRTGSCLLRIIQNVDGLDAIGGEEEVREPLSGSTYLACTNDGAQVKALVELDNNTIEYLLQASKLPLGWYRNSSGQLESPWQYSHAKHVKWYNNERFATFEKCSKSGRPLLTTTDDISFSCEPVKSTHTKQYQNPDGDGVFKLTVTNNSNQPVEVSALLRDSRSKKILWEESIFVITDSGNHFFPAHGHANDVEPTVLQPHETISANLDTLTLHGISWPQGGWRLRLKFCLGNKASEGNYYYFTDHHEPIRKKAEKKKTAIVD